ncbi:MAG TPA: site-specific integrase [Candidatus Acidoferrum sp.]|nr:site-specific integrase [Candidatus Acidoferrum sp.]
MLTLYRRVKVTNGKWRAEWIREGRGIRTSTLVGPFFVRSFVNGIQKRHPLHSATFAEARPEADEIEKLYEAQSRGITVNELTAMQNSNRLPLRTVVDTYLEQKKNKAKKTREQYRLTLDEFVEGLGRIKFLDEIDVAALRKYKDFLTAKGFAGKTIDTRINIVNFLLKKNGGDARLPKDEMPVVETEAAVPYSEDEMKKLFREMDKEEAIRYKFFLGTACRDKEVTYAAWADINFDKKTYTVRGKPDEGFTVKNHERRTIPIPDTLAAALKARRKPNPSARRIFVNEAGVPDNHFLRKLKRIALRAGVNCGQCRTTVTKGKYTTKKQIEVSCATDPVCEHIYLHRFRKTCVTRWQEAGVPIRTIQHYLGHKNLETTALYLGVSDSDKMRDKINEAFGD